MDSYYPTNIVQYNKLILANFEHPSMKDNSVIFTFKAYRFSNCVHGKIINNNCINILERHCRQISQSNFKAYFLAQSYAKCAFYSAGKEL